MKNKLLLYGELVSLKEISFVDDMAEASIY